MADSDTPVPAARPTKRILAVAGARPNFVKVAPILERLSSPDVAAGVETLFVHTGQHYDEKLSHLFFQQLKLPRPDIHLGVGSGSHARQTGQILALFEPVVRDWKPDVVVVVGDVNSTLACALAAAKLCVPVAHVEAGLRSFDRSMPEETNRVVTDAVSEYLLVSEPSGVQNLRREGIPEKKIHLVGNVMIDSLRRFLPLARESSALTDFGLLSREGRARPFALVTLHRPDNVDQKEALAALLDALDELGRELPVIFPVHPRTRERLARFHLHPREAPSAECGLRLTPPIGYLEFLHLMSEAAVVLTDSGGIQEETTALGVACLTVRENTERPITVTEGTNTVIGANAPNLLNAARQILAGKAKKGRVPALWDGRTADRIVRILLST